MPYWRCSSCEDWVSTEYPAHVHAALVRDRPTDLFQRTVTATTYRRPEDEVREERPE